MQATDSKFNFGSIHQPYVKVVLCKYLLYLLLSKIYIGKRKCLNSDANLRESILLLIEMICKSAVLASVI